MDEFELLLDREKTALERFVRFRISPKEDADDVMQEIYLAACRNFNRLKNATIPFAFWIQTAAMFLPNSCDITLWTLSVERERPSISKAYEFG